VAVAAAAAARQREQGLVRVDRQRLSVARRPVRARVTTGRFLARYPTPYPAHAAAADDLARFRASARVGARVARAGECIARHPARRARARGRRFAPDVK